MFHFQSHGNGHHSAYFCMRESTSHRDNKIAHPNKIVKDRSGSVLARGMILKADQFETGVSPRLQVHLQGGFLDSI